MSRRISCVGQVDRQIQVVVTIKRHIRDLKGPNMPHKLPYNKTRSTPPLDACLI